MKLLLSLLSIIILLGSQSCLKEHPDPTQVNFDPTDTIQLGPLENLVGDWEISHVELSDYQNQFMKCTYGYLPEKGQLIRIDSVQHGTKIYIKGCMYEESSFNTYKKRDGMDFLSCQIGSPESFLLKTDENHMSLSYTVWSQEYLISSSVNLWMTKK